MVYVKQTWLNGQANNTPLSAARLNYIEQGIEDVYTSIESIVATQSELVAAIAAGGEINLGGKTITLSSQVTIDNKVTIRNGTITANDFRPLLITAAETRLIGVNVTRSGTNTGSMTNNGSAVAVNAASVELHNCNLISSQGPAVRISGSVGDGFKMLFGSATTTCAGNNEDFAAIYVAPASHTYDIVIFGVKVRASVGTGVVLYNCSRSMVSNCDVKNIRRSPLITVVQTWVNTSGSVWRIPLSGHRTDLIPNAIFNNGVEVVENTVPSSTLPDPDRYTTPGDGYLYLNLNGVDPNTRTITTTRTNGYGILLYATVSDTVGMSDNLVSDNMIEDTDNIGIYFQTLQNIPYRNKSANNRLRNVCLEGVTLSALPCAGIGVFGCIDFVSENDSVYVAGATGKDAPGFRIKSSDLTPFPTGKIIGSTFSNCFGTGIELGAGHWQLVGVTSRDNTNHGISDKNPASGTSLTVELIDCRVTNNGSMGVNLPSSAQQQRLAVVGGIYQDNLTRGISLTSSRDVYIGGGARFAGHAQYSIVANGVVGLTVDGVFLLLGQGLQFTGTCTEVFVGAIRTDTSSGTKLSAGTFYRVAGSWSGPGTFIGSGTPEGAVTALVGSVYYRSDGGSGTSMYVKESGTGNTGWVAK